MIIWPGTIEQFAEALYHLQFPKREFRSLPDHVQESYRRDAIRLRELVTRATDA